MIKYLRLPFSFDTERLQADVQLLDSLQWKSHYQVLHYEGEWSGIPLRSIDGDAGSLYISAQENPIYKDTVFLQKTNYLKEVLQHFQCPLKAVRLLKLNAGAVIKEHRDAELYFEKGEARIHIPIITDDAVGFYTGNERLFMREGECWYVNFNLPHRITNNSSINRIHLVIDADVNDWLTAVFNHKDIAIKKEIANDDGYDDATKREIIKRFREMNTAKGNELADNLEKQLNSGM